jgi:ubiquitin-conjugating enzyme E2 J1
MAPSPTIRRLLKETAELSSPSSNPNPAFFAAPVSDADLHEWHFTMLGPPAPSPYAGGIYHGRISLPTTYPLKPPNFRFLTPSGRFEMNREICLSISGFHEETWMPAWGVRTALTALRSFMAEKGSAAQVGGLEAPADVRKRLAQESRSWKCHACGKSNEAIMKEWWEICRDAGLDMKGEEDAVLESLPEGMTLEARDPNAQRAATKDEGQETLQKAVSPDQEQPVLPKSEGSPPTQSNGQTAPVSGLHPPSQGSPPFASTPSAEAVQAAAEAILTPAELASSRNSSTTATHGRPLLSGLHNAPLAAANAAMAQHPQPLTLQRERETQPILSLDGAIAVVFLALCLMVLKKIFFPANTGASPSSMEDFYLQRE